MKPKISQVRSHLDRVVEGLEDAHALRAELEVYHALHGERDALVLDRLFAGQHYHTGKDLLCRRPLKTLF